MSVGSRIARTLLVAVLGSGLALGASAAGAAADQPVSIGVLATPNPVYQGANAKVTLIATVGSQIDQPYGEVYFSVEAPYAYLGSVFVHNGSGPASITVPVSTISADAAGGQFTLDAVFESFNFDSSDNEASGTTSLTIQPALDSLYVADYGSDAISVYGTGASGRPLLGTIAGPATQLSNPEGVVLDSIGDLYVANSSASTITEYAPDASGNATPIASIAGTATGLDNPRFIALDSSGNLYVVNALSNAVTEYAPGARGNATPIATIAGSQTGIDDPIGIAVDPTGRVYVSNAGNNSITAYAPGADGNVAPVDALGGFLTGLSGPKGLFFNSAGQLLVANDSGGVNTYNVPLGGNQAPPQVLAGSATGLINSEQPIIDPSNNTLLVDSLTQGTLNSWPAAATGDSTPTTSVQVGAGAEPTQIAIAPNSVLAQASSYGVMSGQMTIAASLEVSSFLRGERISVTGVDAGKVSPADVMRLPILSGRLTTRHMLGVMQVGGGLRFSGPVKTIRMLYFTLSHVGNRAELSAVVSGRRIVLAQMLRPTIHMSGRNGRMTGGLLVSAAWADQINQILGKHLFSAGAKIGDLTATVTVS